MAVVTRPTTRSAPRWADSWAGLLLWLVALPLFATIWFVGDQTYSGADLYPVWASGTEFLHHLPVFVSSAHPTLHDVATHTIYPPSSLVVATPLGALSWPLACTAAVVAALVCVFGAVAIANVVAGRTPVTVGSGVLLVALAVFPPVRAGLDLLNLEIVLLPLVAAFLYMGHRGRWTAGGAVLGLALAIKPLLIALLLVLVFARAWRALVVAVVVPVALNLVLLPAVADPSHFFTAVVPLLLRGGPAFFQTASVSIQGVGVEHGVPVALLDVTRVAGLVVLCAAAHRAWRRATTPATRVTVVTTILLVATFLSTGLAYNHYVLLLVPAAAVLATGRAGWTRHPVAMAGMAVSAALLAWVHVVAYGHLSAASVAQPATHAFLGVAIAAATAVGVVFHSSRPRRRSAEDGRHRRSDISPVPSRV